MRRKSKPYLGALNDAEDHGAKADSRQHQPKDIEATRAIGIACGVRHPAQRKDEKHDGDRHVDPEDSFPPSKLRKHATQEWADCCSTRHDRTPDAECGGTIFITE